MKNTSSKKALITVLTLSFLMSMNLARAAVASAENSNETCQVEKFIQGKKSTAEVVTQLKEIVQKDDCRGLNKACELRGEGDVSGVWKKHRLFLNNAPIVGSNDLDGLMENVSELRASGFCLE